MRNASDVGSPSEMGSPVQNGVRRAVRDYLWFALTLLSLVMFAAIKSHS
jgi:hypothetical protein